MTTTTVLAGLFLANGFVAIAATAFVPDGKAMPVLGAVVAVFAALAAFTYIKVLP